MNAQAQIPKLKEEYLQTITQTPTETEAVEFN